ncbi:hypothetical protein [Maribellus maritimus]|uniref:hypothetical protein n=1 Tax=Maribellus maritimus TaxID=2870838 RepID=UPI001EEBC1EE|nr:hypothetical protein [Maribellus maritimus]MCG6187669.1 hypothetical protein [Maribellus maritimus]
MNKMKKWTIRLSATGILLFTMLAGIVLNPALLYASQIKIWNYIVYHNTQIDKSFFHQIEGATMMLKESELFDSVF